MKKFSLQVTALTVFALGLIWFVGEGEAVQNSISLDNELFAVETVHIDLNQKNSEFTTTTRTESADNPYKSIRKLSNAIYDIKKRYMIELDTDSLVNAGIRGMLKNLDRYSVLMPKRSYENLMEVTSGKYEGVGMQIDSRHDHIIVIAPLEGGPSEKLGLKAGDLIMKINDESTYKMTTSAASKMMRGKAGTTVTIFVKREGMPDEMEFVIERAQISLNSVNYSGIVPGTNIGYIRLSRFAQTSRTELDSALLKLNPSSLDGLIFDLRSNGGGLLDQAVSTAELFLPRNSMVVYTQGRDESSRRTYHSRRDPVVPDKPLIVLVDEGTASASEIVAGAIQDLDRGIVLGKPTYGKGLVQNIISFAGDTTVHLKLTVARYFVPSGRCIQRPDKESKNPKPARASASESDTLDGDSVAIDSREIFYTQNGRMVFGGGGIVPDIESERDFWPPIAINMMRKTLFFDFASRYLSDHPDASFDLQITDEIIEEFKAFTEEREFDYKSSLQVALENFRKAVSDEEKENIFDEKLTEFENLVSEEKVNAFEEAREDIRLAIRREIATQKGGEKGRYENYILKVDKTIAQAVRILEDKKEYNRILTEGADIANKNSELKEETDM